MRPPAITHTIGNILRNVATVLVLTAERIDQQPERTEYPTLQLLTATVGHYPGHDWTYHLHIDTRNGWWAN